MSLPDSGQPEDYTPEQMEQMLKADKATLTKNQRAAIARHNFQKAKAAQGAGGAPAAPAATAAAKPAAAPAATAAPPPAPKPAAPAVDPKVAKAREEAAHFAYAVELKQRFGDKVEDLVMQRDKPYLVVRPAAVPEVLAAAKAAGFEHLALLTACDWPPERVEMVYDLFDYGAKRWLAVKSKLPRGAPSVPTVSHLWPGAVWLEREVFDMFGVRFQGLADHRRMLLPDGWVGHPMLKDYDPTKEQYVALDERGDDVVTFEEAKGW